MELRVYIGEDIEEAANDSGDTQLMVQLHDTPSMLPIVGYANIIRRILHEGSGPFASCSFN